MKLKIAAAVAVLVLAVAGFFVFTQKPAAPDVAFSTLQGQSFRTADLRGKVVLVNFWATTCTSCIKEMPALKATQERFEARGYRTVAVAMDYDPPAQVAAFVERNPLPFTFVLDRDGSIARGFEGVRLTPTSYILDKRGQIVQKILGEPDFDKLHGLLDQYWDGLYPRADDGDLEERASKLAWFATYASRALQSMMLNDDPQAALNLTGWMDSREVDNLGRQNAEAYQTAQDEGRINGETYDARMQGVADAVIRERIDQVQAAREAFARFSAMADGRLGREAPNLAALDDALKKIQQIYAKVAASKGMGVALAADESVAAGGESAFAGGTGGSAASLDLNAGSLASKDAALRALNDIAAFFRRTEPHSPVAYLLERAVTWANMPLEQFLAELIRDESTLSSIRERVGLPPSY